MFHEMAIDMILEIRSPIKAPPKFPLTPRHRQPAIVDPGASWALVGGDPGGESGVPLRLARRGPRGRRRWGSGLPASDSSMGAVKVSAGRLGRGEREKGAPVHPWASEVAFRGEGWLPRCPTVNRRAL